MVKVSSQQILGKSFYMHCPKWVGCVTRTRDLTTARVFELEAVPLEEDQAIVLSPDHCRRDALTSISTGEY